MNNLSKKILFISHDAHRTGAPIVLLNLADLLKENNYKTDFLLRYTGPLEGDFISRGETFLAYNDKPLPFIKRVKKKFSRQSKFNLNDIKWNDYEYIISNTITNGDLLPDIRKLFNGPILSYIHELEMGTKFYTTAAEVEEVIKNSDGYLTASEGIKTHLIENLLINKSKIVTIPSYIPSNKKTAVNKSDARASFTVGAVGTIDWRKGAEIFILIAKSVFQKRPASDIRFIWKGAACEIERDRLNYDITKLDLTKKVSFLGPSDDIQSFYSEIDLFFLTSREDPYPLVILEAADMSIPSICFENAGGAQEFVKASQGGSVISYLDIDASADEILFYYDNPDHRENRGENAKKWLCATHQNPAYVSRSFEEALEKLLAINIAPR